MIKEKWKPVYLKEYKDIYEVSDQGNVRNRTTKKLYTLHKKKKYKNYFHVKITLWNRNNNKKCKNLNVSRLVYNTFYPTENFEKYHVHHRNSKPDDNRLINLQLLTPKEHYNLEYKQGKIKIGKIGHKNFSYKGPIGQFDEKGILLNVFTGKTDFTKSNFGSSGVYECVTFQRKKHKNFYWRRFPKKFKMNIGEKYDLNDPMFLRMGLKKVFKKKPKEKQLLFDY